MNKDIKISVVVPVYDVSKYLRKCLDSIINQTLKEIEIIIVNDASPSSLDNEICKEYEQKDDRIKYIIHKENKGLSSARNTGVAEAKGEYIGFVDSDDYIHPDMYKTMYEQTTKNDVDIVQCNLVFLGNKYHSPYVKSNKIYLFKSPFKKFFANKYLNNDVKNKIYKRNLYIEDGVTFLQGILHEDELYIFKMLFYANNILLIPYDLYFYVQRENSIGSRYDPDHMYKRVQSQLIYLEEMQKFLIEKSIYEKYKEKFIKYYSSTVSNIFVTASKGKILKVFMREIKSDPIYKSNLRLRVKLKLFFILDYINLLNPLRKLYCNLLKYLR